MSQTSGIVIKNTHLLRAAMLFMVLGIIGPGLFQLKPPQWFDGTGDAGTMKMAAPTTAPPKTSPDNALLPEQPANGPVLSPPPVTEPAPPESSRETPMAAMPEAGSEPVSDPADAAYAARESQSARQTSPSVTDAAPAGKAAPTTEPTTAPNCNLTGTGTWHRQPRRWNGLP